MSVYYFLGLLERASHNILVVLFEFHSIFNLVMNLESDNMCLSVCCRVFTFSDDEEEEKRVVRSQKDKRWDIPCASTSF